MFSLQLLLNGESQGKALSANSLSIILAYSTTKPPAVLPSLSKDMLRHEQLYV